MKTSTNVSAEQNHTVEKRSLSKNYFLYEVVSKISQISGLLVPSGVKKKLWLFLCVEADCKGCVDLCFWRLHCEMCWNANCDQFGCRCKPVSGGVSTFRIIPGSHLTMFYAKPIFVCIVSYGKRMSESCDSSKRHHVILKDTPLFNFSFRFRVVNRRKIDYIWKEMCILLLKTLEYRNKTIWQYKSFKPTFHKIEFVILR